MATGDRPRPNDLSLHDNLVARPLEHHLFQALRIVEAHHADAPRIGEARRPREERVRLGQEAELAFPPSTIAAYRPAEGGRPGKLVNRSFGFFGPNGPLPLHLTEYARNRQRNARDGTLVAFADMLTHRFLALFYRAWREGQPAASHDRAEDSLAEKVSALAGYRGAGFEGRDRVPANLRRHFAGHLALGPRPPEGLVAILSDHFGVPVTLQEFVGTWLELEPDDRWQLGRPAGLGRTTSVGDRVWSRSAKFRLRIGPLSRTQYESLLPGGAGIACLHDIVRSYVGDVLDYDVNLVLAGRDVPRAALDGETRLGQTSWSRGRDDGDGPPRPDAADLFIHPDRTAA
ncbi:type VI secretion system baseplate subunit TssG [Rhodovulum sp. 12E13]|uniref:type VI secretion system baseplate subunit TssG n=1 Tax=Rhodovulum sp. 12E13 TaxID=2203891 RepID=UPI000E117A84|nr:type VI secretion system baseplate subunit TssG [Rhodovulum sp. 12E13]RDC74057.1 type VI secretion system baseplate subunit TssG [Rhodovulum sp. 12E13]